MGQRRIDIVDFLLKEGFNVNLANTKNGDTAIFQAIHYNYVDIVDLLLKYKADLNVVSLSNLTPLYIAIYRNKPEIVKKCLLSGANFSLKDYNSASIIQPLLPSFKDLNIKIKRILLANMSNNHLF